ncbi:hypothetical protein [Albidovulum sp.]|uniref:hypothetical protein n=1 Tax=Albidovulum sp. TaxID=1872424 RepID=UPI001DFF6EC0|nr:hypothetical protein [Paracoccaceae bacterium]HPE26334.1 hypothetical protein [Albidovulum sp.]MCB2120674.1 hypothetical protein [Paracoccaceae bacterium]MCB2138464.1 hypothetical protein [Paracoccaceae bacterium]MCB2141778.1 hypothetical protein [Paracoccaceae bacterium]
MRAVICLLAISAVSACAASGPRPAMSARAPYPVLLPLSDILPAEPSVDPDVTAAALAARAAALRAEAAALGATGG